MSGRFWALGHKGQGHSSANERGRLSGAPSFFPSQPSALVSEFFFPSLLRRSTDVETRSSLRSVPRFSNGCKESGSSHTSICDNQTASTNVVIFDVTVCLQQPHSIPVSRLCLNSVVPESRSPSTYFSLPIVYAEECPVRSIKIAGFIWLRIGMMYACRLVIGERLIEVYVFEP